VQIEKTSTVLLREYSAIVGVCFAIGAIASFVIAAYLDHGSIQQFMSFVGNDSPSGYVDSVKPNPLGVHYFGDYLLPRWQSEMSSPWSIQDPSRGPLNNYLPFTMALFWIFSHFSYWTSFIVYMLLPTSLLIIVIWKSLTFDSVLERMQFLVTSVFLTFPFISLMDRGNVQIYVVATLALSLWLFCKNHATWGAVVLGFSIALKGYPIFLIAIWIHARRWKDVFVAAITSLMLTVAPLLLYDGGITRNISRIFENVRINEDLYAGDSLAFNNSLRGFLLTLTNLDFLGTGHLFHFLDEKFLLVFLVLAIIAGSLLLFSKIELVEIVVLSLALMSLFVDFVAGYALGVYFLFIIAIGLNENKIPKWPMRFLMFSLAIQMAPKGFSLQFWNQDPSNFDPSFNSLLGGMASLMSIAVVVIVVLSRTRNGIKQSVSLDMAKDTNQ
jgi:hypothetical protein